MIIDYRIIRATDHNALASDVKEALATCYWLGASGELGDSAGYIE